MKRFFFLLLLLLALVSILALSCSKPAPAPTTSVPAPAVTTTGAPKPVSTTSAAPATTATTAAPKPSTSTTAPAQAQAAIKWKYQHHEPSTSFSYTGSKRIIDKINTASGGRLVVEIFQAGAVAPALKEIESVNTGALEAASFPYEAYVYLLPAAGPFGALAGGLTPVQKMMWFISGGGEALVGKLIEKLNVVSVGNYQTGTPEVFLIANKELKTVADMKGLKVRAAGEGGEILARMGTATVMMPGGELYESMKRGVIDAFEYGGPYVNWTMAFHEVAKYVYMSPARAPGGSGGFAVNKAVWSKLPDDLKGVVKDAVVGEPLIYYSESVKLDQEALQKYLAYGTVVTNLPKEVEDTFLKTANAFFDEKAAKDPLYAEIIKSQRDWKALCELQNIR